jgi:hypothetical protein
VNRRRFLYFLTSLTAGSLSIANVTSPVPDKKSRIERHGTDARFHSDGRLRVGIVGVGGPGGFYLNRVAESFNYPCKRIAIARNMSYPRFSCAEDALLVANNGSYPSMIGEARPPAQDPLRHCK